MNGTLIQKRMLAVMLGAATIGGCGHKVVLRQYPRSHDPHIRVVAVAPFVNKSLQPLAGLYTAEQVAAALADNGTYEVVWPSELRRRLNEAGTRLVVFDDPRHVAERVKILPDVDAVLVGTVTRFDLDQYTYTGHGSGFYGLGYGGYRRGYIGSRFALDNGPAVYPYDDYGGAWHPARGRTYGRAEVEAAAVLARTDDGKPIDADKCLRTAVRSDDETLKVTDNIEADDAEIVVVAKLPPNAANNPFTLVLTRTCDGATLAERKFIWSPNWTLLQIILTADEFVPCPIGNYLFTLTSRSQKVAAQGVEVE